MLIKGSFVISPLVPNLLKNGNLRALTLILVLFSSLLSAQEYGFIPNQGQWSGEFDFRLERPQNFVFIKAGEQRVLLQEAKPYFDHIHDTPPELQSLASHAYRLKWLGANTKAKPESRELSGVPKINYLLGNDRDKWAQGLKQQQEILYRDLYPNIDLRYYLTETGACKFDFIIRPGGDPDLIKFRIDGAKDLGLIGEDLAVLTDIQNALYSKPLAYQGEETVASQFKRLDKNTFAFDLGDYDDSRSLIIDPTLVFSTYSGSTDDNFGLTATYGEGGMAYGAGINFFSGKKRGFPTTLGAFQDSSLGVIDISIAKYTADGTAQVYATYLGGVEEDVPYSLLEGPDKSLIIIGATGSPDFPVSPNAYDTTFAFGPGSFHRLASGFNLRYATDIFVSRLDSTGGNLIGSTFLGDSLRDGVNQRMEFNYGDGSRGDITLDANNNILISSFVESGPFSAGSSNTSYGGEQDGLVVSFSPDLAQLNWLSYVGGESNDAVFSLRYTANDRLLITGATESDTIGADTVGVFQPFRGGKVDAFIAELDPSNGQILKFSYSGGPEDDLSYFLDLDPSGDIVIFGQTYDLNWPIVGDSVWGRPGNPQFLQEFSEDLSQLKHSTTFGNDIQGVTAISPTALLVSDCGDVFISGWGAGYNSDRGFPGRPRGMEVTKDAYRDSSDQGDFYLMRMDASWRRLEYATFFGQVGFGPDHVDGGSSRFRKDGSIFQAVCSCGNNNQGFPTTPNAFADTKGNGRCNMAVFRFDMEADTIAADIRLASGINDSLCLPDSVRFDNFSFNADLVFVRDSSNNLVPFDSRYFPILDSGVTRFSFVVQDTNCGLVDSSFVDVYAYNAITQADFEITYDSCDVSGGVLLQNMSSGASRFTWTFNGSDTLRTKDPQLNLSPGLYAIELIAEDPFCNQADTLRKNLEVKEIRNFSSMRGNWDACDPQRQALFEVASFGFHNFKWEVDGVAQATNADSLQIDFNEGGFHTISLEIGDTVCNRSKSFEEEIYFYDEDFELSIPNVFSPNGDQINDLFRMVNAERFAPLFETSQIEIYNRHGVLLFRGDFINEAWDGTFEGADLPAGVYFYVFNYQDICGNSSSEKGFVHLQL